MRSEPVRLPPAFFLVAVAIGLIAAWFLGRQVGNGNFKQLAAVAAVVFGLVVCLTLKTKIWLIIPFCWGLTGQISVLPLPFSVRELSVLVVFGLFLGFFALKISGKAHPMGWIDLFVVLNIGYLVTVFLRNPVGLSAFGSNMVGGRPYFGVFIAGLAFWIMSRVTIDGRLAKRLPFILFMGPMLVSAIGLLTFVFPASVPIIAPFYNGIEIGTYMDSQQGNDAVTTGGTGRISSLAPVGQIGILAMVSYFRPISCFLPSNPFRLALFTALFLAALLSGFRGALLSIGVYLSLSSYFRTGGRDVIRIGLVGVAVLLIAIVGNGSAFTLPLSVQRTLSFLPGNWDDRSIGEAQDSTDWRLNMWKEVWSSDKWIKNKLLGDGFGFSEYDLKIMQEAAWGGSGFIGGATAEAQMIQGAYHSGPLSAIRYVGIVGLILYISMLVLLAFQAAKLIRNARGTDFLAVSLFIGIPVMFEPFNYLVIFGGFDSGFPSTIFCAAMLKMLSHSLKNEPARIPMETLVAKPVVFSRPERRFRPALAK